MIPKPIDWLLEPEQPAVRYRALVDLLDRPKDDPEVKEAHGMIPERGWGHDILVQQRADGHWAQAGNSLYRPKYAATNWKAIMLGDLGLTVKNVGVRRAAGLYFKEWLTDMEKFLAEGELCLVGNLARTLTAYGYADDSRVKDLYSWLVEHQKDDGGWHCFKSDSGTLDCWEGLAAYNALPKQRWTRSIRRSAERGAEFYLERGLFKEGRKYEPWLRFHYPNHYYYDLLVGLDIITALGYAGDRRLKQALAILKQKRRSDGTWVLDAIHPDLAPGAKYSLRRKPVPVSFEPKGEPSKWITMICMRVLKRVEEA